MTSCRPLALVRDRELDSAVADSSSSTCDRTTDEEAGGDDGRRVPEKTDAALEDPDRDRAVYSRVGNRTVVPAVLGGGGRGEGRERGSKKGEKVSASLNRG